MKVKLIMMAAVIAMIIVALALMDLSWRSADDVAQLEMIAGTLAEIMVETAAGSIAPEIMGLGDVVIFVGETYNFAENVTVVSEDKEALLEIDTSQVDFNNPGDYAVIYKATDHKRNASIRSITVTVKSRPAINAHSKKVLYLTFDDGPSAYTLEMLDVLRENGVTATFFVTGCSNKDQLFQNIVDGGHAIGLHTNSHDYAAIYASEAAFFADLTAIEKRVENVVGFKPQIIRFAGGSSNAVSKSYYPGIMSRLSVEVTKRGYKYYDWTLSVADTASNATVATEIANVRNCTSDIICLLAHDDRAITVEAMKTIIPMMRGSSETINSQPIADHI